MFDRQRCGYLLSAMMVPVLLSGCLATPPLNAPSTRSDVKELASDAIATMGDVGLGLDEFQTFLDRLPERTKTRLLGDRGALVERIRHMVLKKYLVQQAMQDEAMVQSGALRKKRQAEDETLRSLYLSYLTVPQADYPDQATLRRVYRETFEKAKHPVQIHLRQIFVPFGDNREAARVKSEALLAMARNPKADFSSLARKLSMDPVTAPHGGSMGFVPITTLPQSFRKGLKGVENGGIAGPLETDLGYHIIQKVAESSTEQQSFGEVSATLRKDLRQQRTSENMKAVLARWNVDYPVVLDLGELTSMTQGFLGTQNQGQGGS